MKNVNKFHIAKVQLQGVAQHLLDFLPISAWRCWRHLKVLLIKKACIISNQQYSRSYVISD